MIVKTALEPSRDDAVRLTRLEKMGMIVLAYAATLIDELRSQLKSRIAMVEGATEEMDELSERIDKVLHDVRLTVPIEQRAHLQNTAMDYEMRLTPKLTPGSTNVIMQKEEFRELVDCARAQCKECAKDGTECETCKLYKLLTVILPLEDYSDSFLCPYVLKEWGN